MDNFNLKYPYRNKDGKISKKKNTDYFGCIPYYIYNYQGNRIKKEIRDWNSVPIIRDIAISLSSFTGQEYHMCLVQLYNNGESGIKPHRDKEMLHGSIITSISLGTTRTMRFERNNNGIFEYIDIPLKTGALCLIMPPTNDYWLHSITTDKTETPRISLIFRNCTGMF